MLKRIATSTRAVEALGLFCVVAIVAILTWAITCAAQEVREREREDDALQSPVVMDDLQVNALATFMNNGYWSLSAVVIGQVYGGAPTARDSEFVSYSTTGGCTGAGCAANAEWHDAVSASSQGAGPSEAWYVTDGAGHAQGQAATTKVAKHNSNNSDAGGDYQLYVRQTAAAGGGMALGYQVDANLHVQFASTTPAPTSCGSSPAVTGGDAFMFGTTGAAASGCTIPWSIPYDTLPPGCFVVVPTGVTTVTWVESTTNIVLSFGVPGQYPFRIWCAGGQ